ncbi:PstS family phosphate ABC transporter substrate-binding protein [soil metagenome]
MKNRILFLAMAFAFVSCGNDAKQDENQKATVKKTFTVKGSDTMLPLSQQEAESFMKTDSLFSVSIVGGGSGVGISALIDGTTDLAMSSRDLKMDEKLKLEEKKFRLVETVVGFDALSVIVNPANKVGQLTREQLEEIFTGKIKNWKEVGGADEKIIVYSRESSSGTYEFFKEHVMGKKNYAGNVLSLSSTGAIIQSVAQTSGAIGYVGMAYADKSVKTVGISYDQGKTFVLPSLATAIDKTYPVSRPLYYFYDENKAALVKPFVDYVLSEEGQKVLSKVGYVPVK